MILNESIQTFNTNIYLYLNSIVIVYIYFWWFLTGLKITFTEFVSTYKEIKGLQVIRGLG